MKTWWIAGTCYKGNLGDNATSVFPGAAICLVVVIFNVLGEGLRDALDPHARK